MPEGPDTGCRPRRLEADAVVVAEDLEGLEIVAAMEEGGAPRLAGMGGIFDAAALAWFEATLGATPLLDSPGSSVLPREGRLPTSPLVGDIILPGPLYTDASLRLCPSGSESVILMLIVADMVSPESEPVSSGIWRYSHSCGWGGVQ